MNISFPGTRTSIMFVVVDAPADTDTDWKLSLFSVGSQQDIN